MNFHWNNIYKKKQQLAYWPWSEVVSLINKFSKNKLSNTKTKILEIGFGAGANIPFFLDKNLDYHGIDYSNKIVEQVKKKNKKIAKKLLISDINDALFPNKKFDIILDRACLTHNSDNYIKKSLSILLNKMKKDSIFYGINWYSTKTTYLKPFKKKKKLFYFSNGPFRNLGSVNFFTKSKISNFFKKFKIVYLAQNTTIIMQKKKFIISSWSIVAKKK
jgi:hypothetical protein